MKPRYIGAICSFTIMIAMAILLPANLHAQDARGTIRGRVTDQNQAAIPGAVVKITNVAQGTSVTSQTNEEGLYQALYLIPGKYQITVEAAGFKKVIREDVTVQVNDTLEINMPLEVGGSQETVTITSDGAPLETGTASLGQVVDARRVAELPLPHGDPFFLVGLAAGTSFGRDPRLDRPFEPTHIVGYSVDGTRPNRSDVTIDGAPSTSVANANEVTASYVPPTDIIQEVKVQTATFDAQFGNTEGGVTNISIKSGQNDLHGTAYWVKMPVKLTANDWYANRNRTARPEVPYDRPGFTVTGPVYIPWIYDGRNRTFFSWGYEYIKDKRTRNNGVRTVPTAAMKQGDFSALLALGSQYQIYNPYTRRVNPANPSTFIQDPFPGNIIPAGLINPVSRQLLQYFPNPLNAPSAADGTNNYLQPDLVETAVYDTNTIRIDHIFNENHRMFGRASWYDRNSDYNNYFQNLSTGQEFQFISRQFVLDDVYTFNPTTVLNLRYGYNRFIRVDGQNSAGDGFDLTSVGFPGSYQALVPKDKLHFPAIDIAGYQGTRVNDEFRPNDIHSFSGIINKALNLHSLKFGVEFRAYRENSFNNINDVVGRFNFDGNWTKGPLNTSSTSPSARGQSFADFLLGFPSPTNSYIARLADYAEQSTTWGFFVQDDWKVTSKLTLNLGLRYEFEGAMTERHNRSVRSFDPTYVQPIEAAARAKYTTAPVAGLSPDQFFVRGGLTFAGVNGEPTGLYNTPKGNFMPRVGFAYQLNPKTVLRGGYGIFYGFLGQRRGDVNQTGFSQNTNFQPSLASGPTVSLSNPLGAVTGIQEPVGSALGYQTNLGNAVTFFNSNPKQTRQQRWTIGIQRELPWGFVAEASYVGNHGSDIEISQNFNVTPQRYLSRSPIRDAAVETFLGATVANPFNGLPGVPSNATNGAATIGAERLLRPFPVFDSVNGTRYDGKSWYHSGQFTLEKRFSKGYTLNLAYTWSKFLEATEVLNQDDPAPTKMLSPNDVPHTFRASFIYELPFGKGKALGDTNNPILSRVLSGWQITGIYQYSSGALLNFSTNFAYFGDLRNIFIPGDERNMFGDPANPNMGYINKQGFVALRNGTTVVTVGGQPVWVDFNDPCKTSGLNNAACLAKPIAPTGFLRDSSFTPTGRNIRTMPLRFGDFRTDAGSNIDLSLFKNTRITEKTTIQFRVDLINALNHPWLVNGTVQLNPTAADFGNVTAGNQANYARRVQLMLKFIF